MWKPGLTGWRGDGAVRICWLTDKAVIRAFLETDRPGNAYALADLDEPFFARCRWPAAEADDGRVQSLLLIFEGLTPPVLLAMGRADYVPDILAHISLPETAMLLGQAAHMAHLARAYRLEYQDSMLRMVLPGPARPPKESSPDIMRLDDRFLPELQSLYRQAHGNAFASYQLRQGVFYGLQQQGQLAAVAGTHIVSPAYRVAAVGNVFTRPEFRGQGYARQVTYAVCRELQAQGMDIVLNVEQSNHQAVHVYKKLGFRAHCVFQEGAGRRKYKTQIEN